MRNMWMSIIVSAFLLVGFSTGAEALIIIDSTADLFTVGNFQVFGNNQASGTGKNYEVLKFSPGGSSGTGTAFDGSSAGGGFSNDQAPHGNVKVADLWTHLTVNGITSARYLVFGFDVNQNDCANDSSASVDCVDITSLAITLTNGSLIQNFTLGGETVRVFEINGEGSSTAEARFLIDTGSDFMQTYSVASTAEFRIQATHAGTNSGFEEYFLSSVFTGAANNTGNNTVTPEPASMLLFGSGLAGFLLKRRMKK